MAPAAFDDYENRNLARDPAHAGVLKVMLGQLEALANRWNTPFVNPNPPSLTPKVAQLPRTFGVHSLPASEEVAVIVEPQQI